MRRVRYAVVGQGYIAQVAVLPAFAHVGRNSELAAHAVFIALPNHLHREYALRAARSPSLE